MRKSFTYKGVRFWVRGEDEQQIAERKEKRIEEIKKGIRLDAEGMTVNAWAEEWFNTYREPLVSEKTLKDDKGLYRNAVAREIGTMQIEDVRQWHLQELINSLDGKSKAYCIKVRSLLSLMFGAAMDNRIIDTTPAIRLKIPQASEGHRRALTKSERIFFLMACEKCGKAGLWGKVMFYCGLRPGETADIRREDLYDGFLHVRGTKTKAADRLVPLPNDLALEMLALGTNPIFQTANGDPFSKTARKRAWQKLVRQMNIIMGCEVSPKGKVIPPYRVADDLVPYCLRHNFATMLQESGVEVGVASKILGHTDIKTTLNIYTHNNIESIREAGNLLYEKMY